MYKRKVKKTSKTMENSKIIKPQNMKRKINTTLIGKEEEFKMLELSNTLSLPLLFIGKPGTSKTKIVLDYMNAVNEKSNTFILETDEGTPNSAVKGNVDLEKLFTENKFETIAPIAKSNCILINEIDKGSSMIRNSLLGIMNERILFAGKEQIKCDWEVFVATCNQIPKQEKNSPFFDRFILKHEVTGLSSTQMLSYFNQGGRSYQKTIEVNCAIQDEMDKINIPDEKLKVFIELFIDKVSNRTLTYAINMIKAVCCIWEIGIDQAMIKTAEIMASREAATELITKLYSEIQLEIISKVEMLRIHSNQKQKEICLLEIRKLLNKYNSKDNKNDPFVMEIELEITKTMSFNDFNLN